MLKGLHLFQVISSLYVYIRPVNFYKSCYFSQIFLFFSLSDLPSVISAEKLSFIDPHERFFVEEGKKVTGYTWHLKDDYKVYKSFVY